MKNLARRARAAARIAAWRLSGSPVPPPPEYKHRLVRYFGRLFRLRTLVETGTFRGDTIYANLRTFDRIWSIELDPTLHAAAVQRFADWPRVHLLQGDSGARLAEVCAGLDGPALFWLDAHYSAGETARGDVDTPIVQELRIILGSPWSVGHLVLIDDARLFNGTNDYPRLGQLRDLIRELRPLSTFTVADDIIRVLPAASR